MIKKQVVIEVLGGVAEETHVSPGVHLVILDYDNLSAEKTEGQCVALAATKLRHAAAQDQRAREERLALVSTVGAAIGVAQWARDNGAERRFINRHLALLRRAKRVLGKENDNG